MYIDSSPELDELLKKADYVKNIDKSISWEPSFEGCFYELKTSNLMNKQDTTNLYNKILSLEKKSNHHAYSVMESRKVSGSWRVIVSLEKIQNESF